MDLISLGRRRHHRSASKVSALLCGGLVVCLFSLFALFRSCHCSSSSTVRLDIRTTRRYSYIQGTPATAGRRRELVDGPGSYPPRCMGKCGECTPCSPVHVAVPPGTPVITEYYPEAWRCKCGNKLYMP